MKKLFAIIIFFLILFEIGLRITGIFNVYSERIEDKYHSEWGKVINTHYKVLPANDNIIYTQKEFNLRITTNQFGMRNSPISISPSDDSIRIICFGDSFTEGDGADINKSYPRQLEQLLNDANNGLNYEVINAGKNGSDLIYAEKTFSDKLYKLEPNLVLFAINNSDLDDLIIRGGQERFIKGDKTIYKKGPWYEKNLYQYSHAFRAFIHIVLRKSFLFLNPKQTKKAYKKNIYTLENSMLRISQICQHYGFDYRFVLHPTPNELRNYQNSDSDSKPTITAINPDYIDISYMCNTFETMIEKTIELHYEDYAWKLNGHYNDLGYKLMAESILECIPH